MKRIFMFIILTMLIFPKTVFASGEKITVNEDSASISFPDMLSFKLVANSDNEINSVELMYGTNQKTCGNVIAYATPNYTYSKSVIARWNWDMRQSGGEPPGATIWWQWKIKDADGNTLLTDKKTIVWLDNSHSWKEIDQGMIRLHYYLGDAAFGNTLKDAAVTALDRLSKDTGIIPEEPIDLYIYGSQQDMKDAVLFEPGWTGGLAYPEYRILIIGIAPADVEWGKRTEAHELTHVLVGSYTFTCMGSLPTWLEEGLAVYGEGGPEASEASYFDQNKTDNTLLSFRVLSGGFSEDPNKADLSYSQSYYMVNYLITQYGKDKLLSFLKLLSDAGDLDESLKTTYGFDLAGFEKEWRASLGLPPAAGTLAVSSLVPTTVPTIIPIHGVQPASTITPRVEPTVLTTATPGQNNPIVDIPKLFTGNNIKTVLAILLGCSCLGGIILVAVLTLLIVRKSKKTSQIGEQQ